MRKRLMLIDGNSLLLRGFFATNRSPDPLPQYHDGRYMNGVQQFFKMMFSLIESYRPSHLVVAFDVSRETTWRRELYPLYKAQRSAKPPELAGQVELAQELLERMEIAHFADPRYEADDIIGTLTRLAEEEGNVVNYIVTKDGDAMQLLSSKTCVLEPRQGVSELAAHTVDSLFQSDGIMPHQVIDVKALAGDSGDNIPGVPGVGEKHVYTMVKHFGSVKELYERLAEVGENPDWKRYVKKLEAGRDMADLSKKLATIVRDVPGIDTVPIDAMYLEPCQAEIERVLAELNLNYVAERYLAG